VSSARTDSGDLRNATPVRGGKEDPEARGVSVQRTKPAADGGKGLIGAGQLLSDGQPGGSFSRLILAWYSPVR
jgi:hypothetical protein